MSWKLFPPLLFFGRIVKSPGPGFLIIGLSFITNAISLLLKFYSNFLFLFESAVDSLCSSNFALYLKLFQMKFLQDLTHRNIYEPSHFCKLKVFTDNNFSLIKNKNCEVTPFDFSYLLFTYEIRTSIISLISIWYALSP